MVIATHPLKMVFVFPLLLSIPNTDWPRGEKREVNLRLRDHLQAVDGGANLSARGSVHKPCATSNNLSASPAFPDAHGAPLHGVLTAERAGVLGVLCHLHLLDLLTQGGTIAGSVLSRNSNLLCPLGHLLCLGLFRPPC